MCCLKCTSARSFSAETNINILCMFVVDAEIQRIVLFYRFCIDGHVANFCTLNNIYTYMYKLSEVSISKSLCSVGFSLIKLMLLQHESEPELLLCCLKCASARSFSAESNINILCISAASRPQCVLLQAFFFLSGSGTPERLSYHMLQASIENVLPNLTTKESYETHQIFT